MRAQPPCSVFPLPVRFRIREFSVTESVDKSVFSAALIVPFSLNFLVIARVSTPLMPGTPFSASQEDKSICERQFETIELTERTTIPATCG
jgi:hypothetical protein